MRERGLPGRHLLVRDEQGNTLIELALVLPVFFTVIIGFIFFAMAMFEICNATYAGRAAMRYACLHSTANAQPASADQVTAMVAPMILPYPPSTTTATLTYSAGNVVGSTATVTVTLNFQAGMSFKSTASGVVTQ